MCGDGAGFVAVSATSSTGFPVKCSVLTIALKCGLMRWGVEQTDARPTDHSIA